MIQVLIPPRWPSHGLLHGQPPFPPLQLAKIQWFHLPNANMQLIKRLWHIHQQRLRNKYPCMRKELLILINIKVILRVQRLVRQRLQRALCFQFTVHQSFIMSSKWNSIYNYDKIYSNPYFSSFFPLIDWRIWFLVPVTTMFAEIFQELRTLIFKHLYRRSRHCLQLVQPSIQKEITLFSGSTWIQVFNHFSLQHRVLLIKPRWHQTTINTLVLIIALLLMQLWVIPMPLFPW